MKKRVVSLAIVLAMLWAFVPAISDGLKANAAKGDFEIEDGVLVGYHGKGGDVVIPNNVKAIGHDVFWECGGLKSVTMPDSVKEINEMAFCKCLDLKSVTLSNSLTEIGDWAFMDCYSLNSITIPSSVTYIGDSAFQQCIKLKTVHIPENVSFVGPYAFYGCTSLKSITVDPNNKNYTVKDGILYDSKLENLIACPATKKGKVTIPDSVIDIWPAAFGLCDGLTEVKIGKSVNNIDYFAFSDCTGLTSVTIPGSVKKISYEAFSGCKNLKSVYIPKSVTLIMTDAFSNTKVTDVYYAGTQQQWKKIECLDDCEKVAFSNKNIGLSKNVTIHYNYSPSSTLAVTSHPANVSAKAGATVTFTVKASGSGLKYQWYFKKSGAKSWTKWSNKTSATLSFKMTKAWNKAQFYCLVKNGAGKSVKSKTASVTLIQPLKITTQPKNKTVKTGKKAAFSVKATGDKLSYQWYYRKKGAKSWTKWSGKTAASVSLKAAKGWNGAQFYCLVKDSSGKSVKSKTVRLTVKTK